MQNTCIFCQIVSGMQKSYIIYENKDFLAFLDARPVFLGHTLLIPKNHYATLIDLDSSLIKPYFMLTQDIARAIEQSGLGQGSFVAINNRISQSVPHLHTHIVPRKKGDGLKGFFWPRQKYASEEEIVAIQKQLKEALQFVSFEE